MIIWLKIEGKDLEFDFYKISNDFSFRRNFDKMAFLAFCLAIIEIGSDFWSSYNLINGNYYVKTVENILDEVIEQCELKKTRGEDVENRVEHNYQCGECGKCYNNRDESEVHILRATFLKSGINDQMLGRNYTDGKFSYADFGIRCSIVLTYCVQKLCNSLYFLP